MRTIYQYWFPRDEPGISELNGIGVVAIVISIVFVLAARRYPDGSSIQNVIGAFYIGRLGWAMYAVVRRRDRVAEILADGDFPEAASYFLSKQVWYHASYARSIPYFLGLGSFLAAMAFSIYRTL